MSTGTVRTLELLEQFGDRVDAGEAIPIDEIAKFPSTRLQYRNILWALNRGRIVDKSGGATKKLVARAKLPGSNSHHNELVNTLVLTGWVKKEVNGKRTFKIELLREVPADEMVEPSKNGKTPQVQQENKTAAIEAVEPTVPSEVEPSSNGTAQESSLDDDLARELGMRPGRLAARIEKAIPQLVEKAVADTMDGLMVGMLGGLGFTRGVSLEEFSRLQADNLALQNENALARGRVQAVEEELAFERNAHKWYADLYNERVKRSNEGQIASKKSLTEFEVAKEYRDVAHDALAHGFTILRTRGEHLAWRSPTGGISFSAKTPGDQGSARLVRADLERNGLPRLKERVIWGPEERGK